MLSVAVATLAQPTGDSALSSPENGPRITDPGRHAITGGTVHLPNGAETNITILINDGEIQRLIRKGDNIDLTGYRLWQLNDEAHVYPGFIDPWVPVETPEHDQARPGRHWNSRITPDRSVLEGAGLDDDTAKSLREIGFVAAGIAPNDGILRGLGAVVSTAPPTTNSAADDPTIFSRDSFHALDFYKSGWSRPLQYPTSQMGCIALIRQTIDDAQWQASSGTNHSHNSLDALTTTDAPIFFNIDHELEAFQAHEVIGTFQNSRNLVLIGNGTEFKRLDAIAETGASIIVPLRFPRKPDVSSVGKAESVDLSTMMLWEQAPTNARRLAQAGVTTSLTTSKSRKRAKFFDNLHTAIDAGLSADDALAMITTIPAELLGVDSVLGTIAVGQGASLVIASGDLFDPDAEDVEIRDVWIEGTRYEMSEDESHPFDGAWTMFVGPEDNPSFTMPFVVDGDDITIIEDDADHEEASESDARHIQLTDTTISFLVDDSKNEETHILSGVLSDGRISGSGISPDSNTFTWAATRDDEQPADDDEEKNEEEASKDEDNDKAPEHLPGYPFGAYAYQSIPEQETVLFTNATIWTSGPAGIIDNGSILIENGKISVVTSSDIAVRLPNGARTIDLQGKHITPGIVDAHSHTGTWTFGTNEGAQAVTAEVRMEDTTDPDHINWYRQLAAGVTTVNTLHGSANPIGGQNVIQKVRWGAIHPRDMHLKGAKAGIKFALGENVTHANWGNDGRDRYPQTRMGVDTIMRDRFTAAQQYAHKWTSWFNTSGKKPDSVGMSDSLAKSLEAAAKSKGPTRNNDDQPRRDHELDALAEILAGDRLVHCHSYRQDEILMLAEIAREYNFTIGTYQHGLEAYKVAEVVRERSRGASIFSDWWAFKVEVQDAIPQGGPIMYEAGVTVSYNSDSDNMVRRLNTEAAKAIKYGNVPEDDAFKFVTINPAYQLNIEDRVGSIEVGKDADLAIWSGHPMSTFSQCEQTWIDGRQYFSTEMDDALRTRITAERARLIAKINGKPDAKDEDEDSDDDEDSETPERLSLAQRIQLDQLRKHNLNLWLEGKSPATYMQPGDCGCGMSHLGVIR